MLRILSRLITYYGLLVVFFISHHLKAASFECTEENMQGSVDRLLCINPSLSELDEKMAIRYKSSFIALNPKARVELLKSQRGWLIAWPQKCLKSLELPEFNQLMTREFIECAQKEYNDRLSLLEVKTIGRFKTFTVAKYANVKVKQDWIPATYKAVDHQLTYPQVDVDTTSSVTEPINQWILQTLRKFSLKNRANLNEDDVISNLDIELSQQVKDIYSICIRYTFYGFGAHPNTVIQRYQWLDGLNRQLRFNDIFMNTLWVENITEKIVAEFTKKYEGMFLVSDQNVIQNAILDLTHWEIGKEGLTLHFMPYELTAYAAGSPEFFIPKNVLEKYLTAFALEQMQ